MGAWRGTDISVVEQYEGIVGMRCGKDGDAHVDESGPLCCGLAVATGSFGRIRYTTRTHWLRLPAK
jgi:hypothetical protein